MFLETLENITEHDRRRGRKAFFHPRLFPPFGTYVGSVLGKTRTIIIGKKCLIKIQPAVVFFIADFESLSRNTPKYPISDIYLN